MKYVLQLQESDGTWEDTKPALDSLPTAMEELKKCCTRNHKPFRVIQVIAETTVTIVEHKE